MTDLACTLLKPHQKELMRQEVIRDFLNLPGIVGITLMDGRSQPYFWGFDQILNSQQKASLSQGILQVVGTIPDGFETFEFQFMKHQIFIYKLSQQLTLTVLAQKNLAHAEYATAIKRLQTLLQADITNAVARLRSTVNVLSEADDDQLTPTNRAKLLASSALTPAVAPVVSPRAALPNPAPSLNPPSLNTLPPNTPSPNTPSPNTPSPNTSNTAPRNTTLASATLTDLLIAFNTLSQFTTHYLGRAVIVNYLKTTRPNDSWLNNCQIERTATIICASDHMASQLLSHDEQQLIQTWAIAFVQRCSQTIRDFPTIVKTVALSRDQKALLLKDFGL